MHRFIIFARALITVLSLSVLAPAPAAAQMGFSDGSFDSQGSSLAYYCYFNGAPCPSGPWSGDNAGLIKSSNPDWGSVRSPSPTAMAFVQVTGQLRQTFTATQTAQVRFVWLEADRPGYGGQTYEVSVNGVLIGTYTSGGVGFRSRESAPFSITNGTAYTVAFTGQSPNVDRSSLIDNIQLRFVDGGTENYSYDALGRLIKTVTTGGQNSDQTQSICYDAAGNRKQYVANDSAGATGCSN